MASGLHGCRRENPSNFCHFYVSLRSARLGIRRLDALKSVQLRPPIRLHASRPHRTWSGADFDQGKYAETWRHPHRDASKRGDLLTLNAYDRSNHPFRRAGQLRDGQHARRRARRSRFDAWRAAQSDAGVPARATQASRQERSSRRVLASRRSRPSATFARPTSRKRSRSRATTPPSTSRPHEPKQPRSNQANEARSRSIRAWAPERGGASARTHGGHGHVKRLVGVRATPHAD